MNINKVYITVQTNSQRNIILTGKQKHLLLWLLQWLPSKTLTLSRSLIQSFACFWILCQWKQIIDMFLFSSFFVHYIWQSTIIVSGFFFSFKDNFLFLFVLFFYLFCWTSWFMHFKFQYTVGFFCMFVFYCLICTILHVFSCSVSENMHSFIIL